jgi:cell wall-associated NlpC family hydrolase
VIAYFARDDAWVRAVEVLNSWKGTPYRHLWMKKGRGADCSLFIGAVLKELNIIKNVKHDFYPPDWFAHTPGLELIRDGFADHIRTEMKEGFELVKVSGYRMRGDMPTFCTVKTNVTNHAGILLDPPTSFIHSVRGRGVSLMNWGSYWDDKTTAVYRVYYGY